MSVTIDDLSLLNEDFANGATLSSEEKQKKYYGPTHPLFDDPLAKEKAEIKLSFLMIDQSQLEIVPPRPKLFGREKSDQERLYEIMTTGTLTQEELLTMQEIKERYDISKEQEERIRKLQGNLPSSESSTKSEDPTHRSPGNG